MAKAKNNSGYRNIQDNDVPLSAAEFTGMADAESIIAQTSSERVDDMVKPKPRILVLDRGFVVIAYCPDLLTVGLYLECHNVRCIRSWGTTEGLGQLVSGPTENTKFDAVIPREVIPVRAILRVIDVDLKAWKHLYPCR